MTTLVGATLAGYTVEAVAGRGGMGVVYRARDAALDRTVALKLIAPELASDEGFRARFEREARITAQLNHPNVIPVLGAGEDGGRLFLAMRWVEGTDLGRLIAERGHLDPEPAADLIAQAASALDAAHAHGLVHRDVKPANLLLTGSGRPHVYLTDFGLARRDATGAALTTTGNWLGTPDYASPEQIEGRELDPRSDVYALGCVLYTALTGRPPFASVPRMRKGWAQVNEPAPPLPGPLGPVVAKALAKDPADRYATAGALGEAAVAAARGERPRTGPTRRLVSRTRRGPKTTNRPRRLYGLAALLALAAVGAGLAAALGAFTSNDEPTPPPSAVRRPPTQPPPPPQPTTTTTVRCSATACTQSGHRVQAPIEDGACGNGGNWRRIDAGSPPLLACVPSAEPPAGAATPLPDITGARLDRAEDYLDSLGIAHDTSGGGALGPIIRDNWQVCATVPRAGAQTDSVKLFIDRSC